MTTLDRLLEGGAHRRYLYGYLSQLLEDNPDWLVSVVTSQDGAEHIWLRAGGRGARAMITQIMPGRELLTIRALRYFIMQVS